MMDIGEAPDYAVDTEASPGLWFAAAVGYIAHIIFVMATTPAAPGSYKSGAEQVGGFIGTALGALLLPLLVVAFSSIWKGNRTQRRKVKVFLIVTATLIALRLVTMLVLLAAFHYVKAR